MDSLAPGPRSRLAAFEHGGPLFTPRCQETRRMCDVTFKTSQENCALASRGYGKVYEWICVSVAPQITLSSPEQEVGS